MNQSLYEAIQAFIKAGLATSVMKDHCIMNEDEEELEVMLYPPQDNELLICQQSHQAWVAIIKLLGDEKIMVIDEDPGLD